MKDNDLERPAENDMTSGERKPLNIVLLGASFSTGNLGVNALAESTIKILLHQWPQTEVTLLGSGYDLEHFVLPVGDRKIDIRNVPIRFSRKLGLPYHFLWFAVYGVLARLLPWAGLRRRLFARNAYCRTLREAHLAVDITGGDSFSDIYGVRRFLLGFLRKWLILLYGKDLVLMPQTYGPFQRTMCRRLARYILKRSKRIYTRDTAGLEYLSRLLGRAGADGKVLFAPDVAFVLDARRPAVLDADGVERVRTTNSVLVGLNVSGLIYYGGYTGHDEFGLKVDYKGLIDKIVDLLLSKPDTLLLLVPHVVPVAGFGANVENDLQACLEVHERFSKRHPDRVFVARGHYDHCEIKHIIGMCDFFIGTRMHACIAALSQGIPAIGLAYSKKFRGVFESVGVGELAVEMREAEVDESVAAVDRAFVSRQTLAARLGQTVPGVKRQVLALLENVES